MWSSFFFNTLLVGRLIIPLLQKEDQKKKFLKNACSKEITTQTKM